MNRRHFLAAGAVLGGGSIGAVALGVPDAVALELARRESVPELRPQVSVTPSHAEAARKHGQRVLKDARTAWDRADTSALDRHQHSSFESKLEMAESFLADVDETTATLQTLEACQYAVGEAAKTLGAARYLNDRFDREKHVEDAERLYGGAEQFRDGIDYTCGYTDLFVVHVERAEYNARQTRMRLDGYVEDDAQNGEEEKGDDGNPIEAAASLVSAVETAKRDLEDGKRIYRDYRSRDPVRDPFADALARNYEDLHSQATQMHEARDEDALDHLEDGPYLRARDRIASHGWYYGQSRLRDATRQRKLGDRVYAAVTAAESLQEFLAWRYGTAHLEITRETETVDASTVADAKRTAVSEFESAYQHAEGAPVIRRLLETARERIDTGDDALDWNDKEYPRAQVCGYYLLGAGHAKYAVQTARRLTRRE
ncbi:hypothetical protein [Halorussus halophilus]|uniref:hypothetical protein n=1 Tax=Halorussus halophilus TaxID=2650975 RepID=UPI00130165A1|nr:hypothetical protein [Halorussus halophilus]